MISSKIELKGEPLPVVALLSVENNDSKKLSFNSLSKKFFGDSDLFGISLLEIGSNLGDSKSILKEIKNCIDSQVKKSKSNGFVLMHICLTKNSSPFQISYLPHYSDSAFVNVVKCMIEEVGQLNIKESFDLKSPILKNFDNSKQSHFTMELNISLDDIDKHQELDSNNETLLQKFMRYTVYGVSGVVAGS